MKTLTLGYSPCPNDTFIFYALVHGKIDAGDLRFKEILEDVEALNQMAINASLDITKVSYHAFDYLRKNYCLLRSGSAMGKGCGPLIVAREDCEIKDLKGKKIAIPGRLTTAYLLLQLYDASLIIEEDIKVMPFYKIMDAVKNGEVDAGLIIHESRFTYPAYGLKKVIDLGEWWEKETGLPLPLGGVIAKRSLGNDLIRKIEGLLRESVKYAMSYRNEPMTYIKMHSQELSADVIEKHINLYVNDYSIDIGEDGMRAVEELFRRAEERGIINL
ncbi:MAG: 1,4-dihydroxy-6-naphthoate synthase [Nitrospirae bacterium]|nr:1,4-dihydroxy-6-naphthoate synthase [Nitrospirota bacterium]